MSNWNRVAVQHSWDRNFQSVDAQNHRASCACGASTVTAHRWNGNVCRDCGRFNSIIADSALYRIRNVNSNQFLTTASTNADTILVMWPHNSGAPSGQQWRIRHEGNNQFSLSPMSNTNARLHLAGGNTDGTVVRTNTNLSSTAQRWHVEQFSNGTFRITPVTSTRSLTAHATSGICIWTDSNWTTQRWTLERV